MLCKGKVIYIATLHKYTAKIYNNIRTMNKMHLYLRRIDTICYITYESVSSIQNYRT